MEDPLVYWFSGTGNSLWVARNLCERLPHASLRSIAEEMRKGRWDRAETTVLVFPVYAWGPPRIVARFLTHLVTTSSSSSAKDDKNGAVSSPIQRSKIYTVVTYAGSPGGVHRIVKKILQRGGLDLTAGFSLKMPGNYLPLREPPLLEVANRLFERAANRFLPIAKMIQEGRGEGAEDAFFLLSWLGELLHPLAMKRFPHEDRRFIVAEHCTGCGLCATLCPVGNIEQVEGRPHWRHDCEQCWRCLHWCPVEAIRDQTLTERKRRYHHPAVSIQDLMEKTTTAPPSPSS